MYITISAQKIGKAYQTYQGSVTDYVNYLEKENEEKSLELQEHFFDQHNDNVSPEKVIAEIDGNTAKLKKKDAKFYSIVVSPSAKELKHINNDPNYLRKYTREIMKDYADSFYRDRKVTVDDIKYYAKIEHERTYRGFEKKIQQNAPYRKEIAKLKHDIAKAHRGELKSSVKTIQKKIDKLIQEAPHKINGKMVVEGMKKEGVQSHVHIIVSRKDTSNKHSLSPGSKYRENTTTLNGRQEKQGFHRDKFYKAAQTTFDRTFNYNRNFVECYKNRKLFMVDTKRFFAMLIGLPTAEKQVAFKLLYNAGINVPTIPTSKVQFAFKAFMKLKRGVENGMRSGSIGI